MRRRIEKTFLGLIGVVLCAGAVFAACGGPQYSGPQLYVAHNIWFQNPGEILSSNFQTGSVIPVGTPITNVSKQPDRIDFADQTSGVSYRIIFAQGHHPGLTGDQIWNRMFTTQAPEKIFQGVTPQELAAVQASKVEVGMTKEAVLLAVGYPPESKTASRNEPTWRYFTTRRQSYFVNFEGNIVVSVTDEPPGQPEVQPTEPPPPPEPEIQYYVAHNLWYEQPEEMYSANFQKGFRIPPGRAVKSLEKGRKRCTFVDAESGLSHEIEFESDHHPQKSAEDVWERMFTTKTYDQIIAGLTPQEVDAVQAGEARKGMSKQAVLISLGYPPEAKTPSTQVDRWRYYKHRHDSYMVHFKNNNVSKLQH